MFLICILAFLHFQLFSVPEFLMASVAAFLAHDSELLALCMFP